MGVRPLLRLVQRGEACQLLTAALTHPPSVSVTNIIHPVIIRLKVTVKPLMFTCPLFREPNKTVKLKIVNIDTIHTNCNWHYSFVGTVL